MKYIREKKSGFYFEPPKRLRDAGLAPESLGTDRAKAEARVSKLLDEWQKVQFDKGAPIRPLPSAPGLLYFIVCGDAVKVGYTSHTIQKRMVDLQVGNPVELTLYAIFPAKPEHEALAQDKLKHLHIRGEWYRFNDEIRDLVAHLAAVGNAA